VNPFSYQGPVEPDELIDRRQELDALQAAAADRVDVRLAAPRRYGKSSLLEAHMASMRGAGHRALRVDFYRVATVADVAARVVRAYKALPADSGRLLDRLSRDLGLTIAPTGVTVHVGPKGDRAAPDAEQSRQILLEVLDIPARLHEDDGTLTVVCFDEFQDLLTADDHLDGLFRSVIQHHTKAAAYVYAGSRPTLMRAMFSDHERPFYAQARPLTLPRLPADETIRHIGAVLERHGVAPVSGLVDIVAFGDGHPQRTMLLAHHLYNVLAADPGAERPAVMALELALSETADVHQAIWEGFDRAERAVVTALADGSSPTGPRTAREHAISRSTMQSVLQRLVQAQQHVVEGPRLLDPLFAEWLRRR
jgi:uncharacterized protein